MGRSAGKFIGQTGFVAQMDGSDAPVLPELLNQIPADQDIGSVTADRAYDTRKCHEAIKQTNDNKSFNDLTPLAEHYALSGSGMHRSRTTSSLSNPAT